MLKILINSYACCPGMGSEPGMGWNWVSNLSKYCEVYVISEGEFREQAEEASKGLPIHWYWNPVSPEVRAMCWNQGDWRFYKYYRDWQKKTAEIAREICRQEQIDILHQLNMIGFREPGYLWKVSQVTGIPSVWGPVDAKESFPMAYADGADTNTKLKLYLKNIITWGQLKFGGRVHQTAKQASMVISASSNSVRSFKKFMDINSVLMNETGCSVPHIDSTIEKTIIEDEAAIKKNNAEKKTFDLLWVGKMDFRKQLGLAIETVSDINKENVLLHVVGGGIEAQYKRQVEELGISDRVVWHGIVSHKEVQKLMQKSDLLFFTSVAEGTPHVVLEAIANGLPVLCFDTCGQGDSVNEKVGRKVPLTTPAQSVRDFADAIFELMDDRETLRTLSANCAARAQELSWDNKIKQMVELYHQVIKA